MVSRSIDVTVERLRQSSVSRNGPGYRYARMLHLLWHQPADGAVPTTHVEGSGNDYAAEPAAREQDASGRQSDVAADVDPLNGFSWRDLSAVGNYIAQGSGASDLGFGNNGNTNDMAGVENNFIDAWQDQAWFANDIVF